MVSENLGYVYFVENFFDGAVKIGFSQKHPADRVPNLRTASHHRLGLMGYIRGTIKDEGRLHNKFKKDRIRGEWFAPSFRLVKFLLTIEIDPDIDPDDSFIIDFIILNQECLNDSRVSEESMDLCIRSFLDSASRKLVKPPEHYDDSDVDDDGRSG